MKIIALLILNVLGFELQVAFYSIRIDESYDLFDLSLDEGLEDPRMTSIIECMIENKLVLTDYNTPMAEHCYSSDISIKEDFVKHIKNNRNVKICSSVYSLLFLANDRLVKKKDLPILITMFRIIKCKKNNWKAIEGLEAKYEKIKDYFKENMAISSSLDKSFFANFTIFCNAYKVLKDFKSESLVALTKRAILFYIKDVPSIDQSDINDFLAQNEDYIFECSTKIKKVLSYLVSSLIDDFFFRENYVFFIEYLK